MAQFVLTAKLALQAPSNTRQVISQLRQQLQGINIKINLQANTSQLNNVNAQLNQTNKAAKSAEKSISDLGKSLGLAARRFGAIAVATSTFLTLSRAIKSSLSDAIEFERQLVNLSQVTGKSVRDLSDISNEITRLSVNLGVSSDGLLRTSVILAQAGLEARKTKAALEVLAKTQLASSFDDIENTTEGAIAILSQFRREAAAAGGDVIYLERALGAINDVSKKFAVESSDLVAVIRRSGGAFEAAGGSLNELLALFTSVRATTRESAETIATGLRTIFTRIQRVDTIRQLQELGIALQDAEGKFVGPFEAIKRISEGLSGLDPRDFRFSAIVEELGGFRQIGKVIPLIKQFTVAQDALNTAQAASGSLAKDAETAQLSLANQIAKVREEFQALIRRFVDSSTFRTVVGGALELAKAFIRIADALEPILPLIASFAAIQIGKGIVPALGAFAGITKRNMGGPIRKFASGGFVPGSGNRDTVPAMLTPGEFVIRKNSANKIGAENLQKLNRGGVVQKFANGGKIWEPDSKIAAVTLEDKPLKSISTKLTKDEYNEALLAIAKNRNINLLKDYNIDKFSIDSENLKGLTGEKLKESLLAGAKAAMEQTAGLIRNAGIEIGNPLLTSEAEQKFAKSIGVGTIGSLFEATLSAIKDPTFSDAEDQGRPFDFIGGLGKAAGLFKGKGDINSYKYVDAKATANAASPKSFKTKIKKQSKLELLDIAKEQGVEAKGFFEKNKQLFSGKTFSKTALGQKIQAGGGPLAMTGKRLEDWLNKNNAKKFIEREVAGKNNQISYIFKKYAKGGAASDNVPALLTPGEFVVNRETAQGIGYGNLNRMNKTGKIPGFAKGGIVGPKRFAVGGPVKPSFTSSSPDQSLQLLAKTANDTVTANNGMITSAKALQIALQELTDSGLVLTKAQQSAYDSAMKQAQAKFATEKKLIDSQNAMIKAQQDAKDKLSKFKTGISQTLSSMQNFVFLAGSVSALAAQFSSLDKVTADAITETIGFTTSVVGIVGTIGEMILSVGSSIASLNFFSAAVNRAAISATAGSAKGAATTGGGMAASAAPMLLRLLTNPITAIIAVVVAALAAVAVYFYYLKARAQKLSDSLNKAADEILESAQKGKGGTREQFVSKRLEAVAALQEQYWFSTKAIKDQEVVAAQLAANALFSLSTSGLGLEQTLANIQKTANLSEADKASMSLKALSSNINQVGLSTKEAFNVIQGIKARNRGTTENLTGADKQTFDDATKALNLGTEQISSALAQSSDFIQKQLEDILQKSDLSKLGATGKDIIASLQKTDFGKNLQQVNEDIRKAAQEEFTRTVQAAAGGTPEQLKMAQEQATAALKKAETTIYDNQKIMESQAEAARKQAESTNAINTELERQRNNFAQANAAVKFFTQQIDTASKYTSLLSRTTARMGGEITTVSAEPIAGLGNLNEVIDPAEFKKQIDKVIAPLGAFGPVVSDQLSSTATLLDKAKKKLLNVRFGEVNVRDVVNDLFAGTNISPDIAKAITSGIEEAVGASTEGASMIAQSEFENIFAPLLAVSEPFRKVVEGLTESQKQLTDANAAYLTEISKLRQQQIDGQRKLIESDIRLAERLAEASQESLSPQQREAQRNARRGFGAADRTGLLNEFLATGDALRGLQESIAQSQDIGTTAALQRQQEALKSSFSNLTDIVTELANQSERASDIMSEIGKERAKRDLGKKIVEDFVVGGRQERRGINRQFQGLQVAAATGTLQGLGAEDRKATFSLLEQLASVDDRFKKLKENLIFSDATRMGLDVQTASALATQTPKEQQLINELRAISAEEKAFQQALNQNTLSETAILIKGLSDLTTQINDFPNKLQNALAAASTDAVAEQDRIEANRKQEEIDRQNAAIKAAEKAAEEQRKRDEAINNQTQKLVEALDPLTKAVQEQNKQVAAKKAEQDTRKQSVTSAANIVGTAIGGGPLAGAMSGEMAGSAYETYSNIRESTQPWRNENPIIGGALSGFFPEEGLPFKSYKSKGGVIYAAKGGPILMEPKGSDDTAAMLTPGEYVVSEPAVNKYGVDFLNKLNKRQLDNESGIYAANGGFFAEDLLTYRDRNNITDRSVIQQEMNRFKGGNYNIGNVNVADMYNRLAERDNELSKQKREELMSRLAPKPTQAAKPMDFSTPAWQEEMYKTQEQQSLLADQARRESSVKAVRVQQRASDKQAGLIKPFQPNVNAKNYRTATERRQQRIDKAQAERDAVQRMQSRGMAPYIPQGTPKVQPQQMMGGGVGAAPMAQAGLPVNNFMAQNPMMAGPRQQAVMGRGQAPSIGFNQADLQAMNNLKATFEGLAGVLNNMQMSHSVTVDGSLNVFGIDNDSIVTAIQDGIANYVVGKVTETIKNTFRIS